MSIRTATIKDVKPVSELLNTLGYFTRLSLLEEQLKELENNKDNTVLICELADEIVGFCAVHFIPQLGFDGGLAIITFLSVKNLRAAKELETHITYLAYEHLCDRIQVHVADFRKDDHKFYIGQGYDEYPSYFTKRLIYAE
jgi:hypothetical protein